MLVKLKKVRKKESSFFYIGGQSTLTSLQYYNNQPQQPMFYFTRNIETEIFFTHHDMDKTGMEAEVLRRLRGKVEGYCDQEYGYLIQVVTTNAPDLGLLIDRTDIKKEGLFVRLKFNCIAFRPSKNEIIPVIVSEVNQSQIMGRAGPAQVLIPQTKLPRTAHYRPQDNAYEFCSEGGNQSKLVKAGCVVFCRCFEMHVEMNCNMKIIGTIEADLLQLAINREDSD